jgi:substrate-binding family protein
MTEQRKVGMRPTGFISRTSNASCVTGSPGFIWRRSVRAGREEAMNMQLVAETLHKPTDTDFSAAVAKLRDADCDMILLGTIVRDTVQIVSALRKVGWRHPGKRADLRPVGGGCGWRDRGHLHHDCHPVG